jgi:hypothetical protein
VSKYFKKRKSLVFTIYQENESASRSNFFQKIQNQRGMQKMFNNRKKFMVFWNLKTKINLMWGNDDW